MVFVSFVLSPSLCYSSWCLFQFDNHIAEKEILGCFTLIVFFLLDLSLFLSKFFVSFLKLSSVGL